MHLYKMDSFQTAVWHANKLFESEVDGEVTMQARNDRIMRMYTFAMGIMHLKTTLDKHKRDKARVWLKRRLLVKSRARRWYFIHTDIIFNPRVDCVRIRLLKNIEKELAIYQSETLYLEKYIQKKWKRLPTEAKNTIY